MALNPSLLARLMATSATSVAVAGKIIRDVLSEGQLNIVEKGKNDLQTEADRSAQKCIVASLSKKFPNITIIGEENLADEDVPPHWIVNDMNPEILNLELPKHLEDVKEQDIQVWVDPLDGTNEFTQGIVESVTVLLGVAIGERAIGGIIHQPFYKNAESDKLGRTIWGIDGVGVGGIQIIAPPAGKCILTTTRSHCNNTVEAALRSMKPDDILRVGGAGYKVLLLMEGKAHAYIFASKGCKRWDTCAPEAVLYAAGGALTNLHGERYSYLASANYSNTGGVFATAPGEKHEFYLNRVPDDVKQTLL